jgi:hypothetical protein
VKRHCQSVTEDGIIECGYLVGSVCKADREHPFTVTGKLNEILSIVGCSSWSKYLQWSNDGRVSQVPELPVKQMGDGRNLHPQDKIIERRTPLPMHVLQEGNNDKGRDTRSKESTGGNMTPCEVCGEQSVCSDNGKHYCPKHHDMWCKCITHEKMVRLHKEGKP